MQTSQPIDIQQLREIYDQFDPHQKGVIEMWRMRELLSAADLHPTDVVLFNLINEVDENGDGLLSFSEFLYFVQKLKESSTIKDADMDLLSSWMVLGGYSNKSGYVKIAGIKQYIYKYRFLVDFDAILGALIAKKNALNIGAKKVVIPDEIDFEDFRALINDEL